MEEAGAGRVEESPVIGVGRLTPDDETGAGRDDDEGRDVFSDPAADGTGMGRELLVPLNEDTGAGDGIRATSWRPNTDSGGRLE